MLNSRVVLTYFLTCTISEQNTHVYVYEDNTWSVIGWYETAIKQDEAVDWTVVNQQFSLKLCLVSFQVICFLNFGITEYQEVDDHTQMSAVQPSVQPSVQSSVLPVETPTISFKQQLITILGIPTHLTGSGDVSLQLSYQKYQAFLAAFQTLEEMLQAKTWTMSRPTKTDIIELFVSKSYFHSHYKCHFPKVAEYDNMVASLNENENLPSVVDLWGIKKEVYTFTDLAAWLDNGGTLVVDDSNDYQDKRGRKGKQKKKEDGKVKEKRKERGKEREEEKEKTNKKKKKKKKKKKNNSGKSK